MAKTKNRNSGIFEGFLGRDPIFSEMQHGHSKGKHVVFFHICQTPMYKEDGEWKRSKPIWIYPRVYDQDLVEQCREYKKGDHLLLTYRLTCTRQPNTGKRDRQFRTEVVCEEIELLGASKTEEEREKESDPDRDTWADADEDEEIVPV